MCAAAELPVSPLCRLTSADRAQRKPRRKPFRSACVGYLRRLCRFGIGGVGSQRKARACPAALHREAARVGAHYNRVQR